MTVCVNFSPDSQSATSKDQGVHSVDWLKEINVAKYIFVGYRLVKAILWNQQSAYNSKNPCGVYLSAIFFGAIIYG
jgi:hypothetical protein